MMHDRKIIFCRWLKQGLRLNHNDNVHWLLRSVPKFVDVGGKRHPNANHFPLSPPVFKPNFPLPIPPRRSNCGNGCFTSVTIVDRLMFLIIFPLFLGLTWPAIFHSHLFFWSAIFPSDTQAKIWFWDTGCNKSKLLWCYIVPCWKDWSMVQDDV